MADTRKAPASGKITEGKSGGKVETSESAIHHRTPRKPDTASVPEKVAAPPRLSAMTTLPRGKKITAPLKQAAPTKKASGQTPPAAKAPVPKPVATNVLTVPNPPAMETGDTQAAVVPVAKSGPASKRSSARTVAKGGGESPGARRAPRPSISRKVAEGDRAGAAPAKPAKEKAAKAPREQSAVPAAAVNWLNPMTPITAYANFAGNLLNRLVPEELNTPELRIAEIENGPQGPGIIAAFDFDGTLIGGYSGNVLFQERRKRKEVSKDEMTESISTLFKTMVKLVEANEMLARAFARWEGKSEAEMEELSEHIYENAIQDSVFPEMRTILEAHRAAGHTLVVATSASRYQVEPAIKALGIKHLLCTELEVKGGKLTGKLAGENLFGPGKAAAIKKFVADLDGTLANTYFYADGSEEVELMESVGHPSPVNPGSKLMAAAKRNKWPVLKFSSRGGSKPMHFLRNVAGMATIGPILQTGLAVGAITRDKRAFANMVMPAWINSNMRMAGVKMRVTGHRHLWNRRPAVFIFNHRNYYDGMIAAALVKTDYAVIAREEMGDNAIGKLIQKIMPTILIKRGTGSRIEAARALEPIIAGMNSDGYSVMLSPEGTRIKGNPNSVGPFKKGAFHIAMAAGVPIVPIVIRNALDVASRSGTMRPGIVDVAVLPPVSVEGWDPRNLGDKVEEVRQMYISALETWPASDDGE